MTENSVAAALSGLLRTGDIMDRRLSRYCCELDERFRVFVSTCPAPQWTPGLLVTAEMRHQYELYLPIAEIKTALSVLCHKSCRYEPSFASTNLFRALSWPDAVARLQPLKVQLNPANLLRQLAADEELRFAFLAALFIPKSFGGGFGRYPVQAEFLHGWLAGQKERLAGKVAILDAACGSGEGAYDAAEMLLQLGYSDSLSIVEGSTLEPLELVAAAYGWFPHDRLRSVSFRERVRPLLACGGENMIHFLQEDLCSPLMELKKYDVIICNGLLGGPLLHVKEALAMVINQLANRLNPGGILLAADHFHQGWQKQTPRAVIDKLLAASGLNSMDVCEGIGAFLPISNHG
jgi:chemotaxis methyl-accepting protein methylase